MNPLEGDPPVFAQPWQAEAFALVLHLHARGAFTWTEWAAALTDQIKAAGIDGPPDDGEHYYEHWLAALERLSLDRGLTTPDAMAGRKAAWANAYRYTPHGKPVVLGAAGGETAPS